MSEPFDDDPFAQNSEPFSQPAEPPKRREPKSLEQQAFEEEDEEEIAEREKAHRKRVVGWTILAAVLTLMVFGGVLSLFSGGKQDAARMRMRTALLKFETTPTDPALAEAAAAGCEAVGEKAKAAEVRQQHTAAVASRDSSAEQGLRARLAKNPLDEEAAGRLVELLSGKKDLEGARAVFAALVAADPTPKRHATFGSWLYRNGFAAPAVDELGAALKDGNPDPNLRGFLGLALYDAGRKAEAKKQLQRAVDDGAEMELLQQRLFELENEAPAPAPAPVKAKASKKRRGK